MRVLPITYKPSLNFGSRVIEIGRGNPPQKLLDAVDRFEQMPSKEADFLGEGTMASAYRFKAFPDCVIKKSLPGQAQIENGDFLQEAVSLEMVPESLHTTQRLVGSVKTEDNNWYLLTTFKEGHPVDGKNVKWDRESLHSLLDSLAKLDAERIYHGDVSKNNCLITSDKKVNLIDFQYAHKFGIHGDPVHRENAERYKVPYYLAPSNAMMFEESTFGTYLGELEGNAAAKLFKEYLEEKSVYHAKRAEAFRNQGARHEIVEYDSLMAKYLKNPTPEVIDLYARKMQILLIHRNINSSFDGYDDLAATIPNYLRIIYESNQLKQRADMLEEKAHDPEYKKFLHYMSHDGYFWAREMKNELNGENGRSSAFEWILRNAGQKPQNESDASGDVFLSGSKQNVHNRPPEIRKHLTGQKVWLGFEHEQTDDLTARMDESASDLKTSQTFYISINDENYKEIKEFHEKKKSILKDLSKCKELYQDDSACESIFYLLSAYNTATLAKGAAQKLLGANLSVDQRYRMEDECRFFDEYCANLENLSRTLYERLLENTKRTDRLR